VPRLTEWIYAGLSIDLLLAFYSQLNGGEASLRFERYAMQEVLQ
jgi:hypothetical protein